MEEDERKAWWDIVEQCWRHNPDQRPTMDEVVSLLSKLKTNLMERFHGTFSSL